MKCISFIILTGFSVFGYLQNSIPRINLRVLCTYGNYNIDDDDNNNNGAFCSRLNICYGCGRLFENFVTDLRSFVARKSIQNRRRSRRVFRKIPPPCYLMYVIYIRHDNNTVIIPLYYTII